MYSSRTSSAQTIDMSILESDLGSWNYGKRHCMIGNGTMGGDGRINDLSLTMDNLVQVNRNNSKVARKEKDSIVSTGELVFYGGGKRLGSELDDISNMYGIPNFIDLLSHLVD